MKVHPLIASAVIGAVLLLQGWTLKSVNELQQQVAALTVRVDMATKTHNNNNTVNDHARLDLPL